MNILGKGVKPVVFENNMKLPFYGTNVEDSYIDVDRIHAKVTKDGVAVAYGECTILLLFSYMNNKKEKFFIAQSKNIMFSEKVDCTLPSDKNLETLDAQATFEPQIICERTPGSGYIWSIEIKGELTVVIRGSGQYQPPVKENEIPSDKTTVMPLNSLNLSASEILEMDTDSLSDLIKSKNEEQTKEENNSSEQDKS